MLDVFQNLVTNRLCSFGKTFLCKIGLQSNFEVFHAFQVKCKKYLNQRQLKDLAPNKTILSLDIKKQAKKSNEEPNGVRKSKLSLVFQIICQIKDRPSMFEIFIQLEITILKFYMIHWKTDMLSCEKINSDPRTNTGSTHKLICKCADNLYN